MAPFKVLREICMENKKNLLEHTGSEKFQNLPEIAMPKGNEKKQFIVVM